VTSRGARAEVVEACAFDGLLGGEVVLHVFHAFGPRSVERMCKYSCCHTLPMSTGSLPQCFAGSLIDCDEDSFKALKMPILTVMLQATVSTSLEASVTISQHELFE
jgi:hypothetical protein